MYRGQPAGVAICARSSRPPGCADEQPGTLLIDCDSKMSNPRVTGINHAKLSATFVELEAVNGTSNFWASSDTFAAVGGTWKGSGFGSEFVSARERT